MTKAQKLNQERFKKVQAEAKKLKAKNPKLAHTDAVKQAWAILYNTGKVKPAAKKVGATKFVNQSKIIEKQKKVSLALEKKYKNWNFPVPPVYTGNWTVKDWSNWIEKNGKKIGAVKKPAAKKIAAVKKPAVARHKDTNSHNVNIKVMSGVGKYVALEEYKKYCGYIEKLQKIILVYKEDVAFIKNKPLKDAKKRELEYVKKMLTEYKTHARELKKLL